MPHNRIRTGPIHLAAGVNWAAGQAPARPPPTGKGLSVKRSHTIRRLRTAVIFAAARGAATATGSALAGLALWWLTHHAAHLLTAVGQLT
jgi:hypothetical protein